MSRSLPMTIACCLCLISLDGTNRAHPGTTQAQAPAGKQAASFLKCAEECNNCQRACDACVTHCAHLLAEGKKEHLATLQTCQDCATHCLAAAAIVARQGPFADLICKACADACARCAKECEKHPDDAQMKQCAQACRRCEQACREMLTQVDAAKVSQGRD